MLDSKENDMASLAKSRLCEFFDKAEMKIAEFFYSIYRAFLMRHVARDIWGFKNKSTSDLLNRKCAVDWLIVKLATIRENMKNENIGREIYLEYILNKFEQQVETYRHRLVCKISGKKHV